MSQTTQAKKNVSSMVQRNWGWLFALGLLFIILGCIGLSMVVGLTIVSMLFFGVILLVGGFLQIVDVFKSKHWDGAFWHALIALLYLCAGGVVIYDPLLASTLFTAIIAWILIIIGISRFIMAFYIHSTAGWGWLLLAGLSAIILGILILAQWPWSGLWVIGLFIAVDLIIAGWTYIFMSLSMRRVNQ